MSGPKRADVQMKLKRALEAMVAQVVDQAQNAGRMNVLGVEEAAQARVAAEAALASPVQLPAEIQDQDRQFVVALDGIRKNACAAIAAGNDAVARADHLRAEAASMQSQAQKQITDAMAEAIRIESAIAGKAHYLHAEDRQADAVRQKADGAVQLERQAGRKLQEAADAMKNARNDFDRAARIVEQRQVELARIQAAIQERKELAARIAEEKQRNAANVLGEAGRLDLEIQSLPHEKFRPGARDELSKQVAALQEAYQQNDFARVIEGTDVVPRLRQLLQDVQQCQVEWDAARKAAENDLAAARNERAGMDIPFLNEWAGNHAAVQDAVRRIDETPALIALEDFAGAQRQISEGLFALRSLREVAAANHAKHDQRQQIAEAIMQALYDQNYDTPEWYYASRDEQGQDKVLADIVIFAKAPGAQGDMRMQIDLSGHVDLEVQNIPEGQEDHCHQLILDLQEGLGDEVDFKMVDWGRAANARKERLKLPEQVKVKQKEKHRDRG